MSQEEFFEYLEILEKWYSMNIINLNQYLKLKSNICDKYTNSKFIADDSELPF